MDLIAGLERLNFTVNESKVYLTLLRVGPSLAGRVAKEAELDRSSTYNALKLLIERGIVSTVFENKRTTYVPADPKKIIDHFKEKEEIAASLVPSLRTQYAVSREKKNLTLFQGYRGLKTIFQDILDSVGERDEYLVLGSEGHFSETMPHYAPLFRKLKDKKRMKTRMLVREGRQKMSGGKYTQYREVPADVVSPATINIYDGKVAILIWDEKPEAILIENDKVSKTFKSYFDFMWKNTRGKVTKR